jgi:hypothetical protein
LNLKNVNDEEKKKVFYHNDVRPPAHLNVVHNDVRHQLPLNVDHNDVSDQAHLNDDYFDPEVLRTHTPPSVLVRLVLGSR